MLTKAQKKEQINTGIELIKKSRNLLFADFTGVPTQAILRLKRELKKAGAPFQVLKKRLLKLALKEAGIDFDPMQFEAQVGVVFVKGELSDVAATIYKFTKELTKMKKEFRVLGVYDLLQKSFLTPEQFVVIAKLPSRDVLLAMGMGAMTGPL